MALVGAGPGDPDLLTVKARDLIAGADYVLHDALIAPETLALCGPDTRLENVGKRGGQASTRQANINTRLIELAQAGHQVVRLKGGDPFVFGRGGEELDALRGAGVDVVIVPGISSALAAPAAAGIPVTRRGVASSVAITTAQGAGSIDRLADLARAADTLVVLMALGELSEVAAVLGRAVGGSRSAAVISNATLLNQRSVSGSLDCIARLAADAEIEAPTTLVVGDVVAAGGRWASRRSRRLINRKGPGTSGPGPINCVRVRRSSAPLPARGVRRLPRGRQPVGPASAHKPRRREPPRHRSPAVCL